MSKPPFIDALHDIVGEIVLGEHRGDIRAIACVVVDRDGDIRTLVCYDNGQKLPILAGVLVLQNQVVNKIQTFEKDRGDD